MSAPWQRAHQRLLQILPVRPHERRQTSAPQLPGRPAGNLAQWRRDEIRRMSGEGLDAKAMAAKLKVTPEAVKKHLRAIAEEDGK